MLHSLFKLYQTESPNSPSSAIQFSSNEWRQCDDDDYFSRNLSRKFWYKNILRDAQEGHQDVFNNHLKLPTKEPN